MKFYLFLLVVMHVNVNKISCDPCKSYRNLDSENDFVRSAANEGGSLCDNFLVAGWYRVNSKAGDRMPTECIYGGFRCGTTFPIWMDGTYPLSGQLKNVTACAASYNGNCCAYTHNIQVKNCSDFLVYYLVPVSSCTQAYCFGSELPCPTGQASKNGFSPGCEPTSQQSASTTSTSSLPLVSELTGTSISITPVTDQLLPVKDEDKDKLVVIITSVVASISTTCLLVILIVWISRRKSSKNDNSDTEKRDQSSYPPTYEEAVRKDTSPHVYDEIGKYETIQKEETVYDEIPEGTQKTAIKPKFPNIYI